MTSTHFHDDHSEIVKGRTQAYEPRKGSGYHVSIPVFDVVGTTSLFTTVEDLAKWDGNFSSAQIGGPLLIEQIQTPGTFNDGKPMTYAWGLMRETYRGAERIGHSGADAGYRAEYLRLPQFGFAVAVFANVSNGNPGKLAEQVADVVLGDYLGPATSEKSLPKLVRREGIPPIVPPTALAGIYQASDAAKANLPYLVLSSKDGKAWLDLWEPTALTSLGNGRFATEENWLTLTATDLDEDGLVPSLEVVVSHDGDEPKTYSRIEPVTLDPAALDAYTGTYWSEELATACDLIADQVGKTLILRQRKRDDQTLLPFAPDVFGRGPFGMVLAFDRDADGAVTGFELSGGRIRNLAFTRQR